MIIVSWWSWSIYTLRRYGYVTIARVDYLHELWSILIISALGIGGIVASASTTTITICPGVSFLPLVPYKFRISPTELRNTETRSFYYGIRSYYKNASYSWRVRSISFNHESSALYNILGKRIFVLVINGYTHYVLDGSRLPRYLDTCLDDSSVEINLQEAHGRRLALLAYDLYLRDYPGWTTRWPPDQLRITFVSTTKSQ